MERLSTAVPTACLTSASGGAEKGRMAVNLSKNGPVLTAAYEEVVDSKSDTNW